MATATTERSEEQENDDLESLLQALHVRVDHAEFKRLEEDEEMLRDMHRDFKEYMARRDRNLDSYIGYMYRMHPLYILGIWT